jgi:GNAT superfamily N-acetyltransferase
MLEIVPLSARPDLRPALESTALRSLLPPFMQHDPIAEFYFAPPYLDAYLETAFAVLDATQADTVVGRAFAVPFAFGTGERSQLPDDGWDRVIRWGSDDRNFGRHCNAVSALEIALLPSARGRDGARVVFEAMKQHVRRLGYKHFFAPVRPTLKHLEPHTPMGDYAMRKNAAGLPFDPWLRLHVTAGGEIVKVAPTSMVIAGTVADWVRWTGMQFSASGSFEVPGALVPVHISLEQDHGVYVEPNVWIQHPMGV